MCQALRLALQLPPRGASAGGAALGASSEPTIVGKGAVVGVCGGMPDPPGNDLVQAEGSPSDDGLPWVGYSASCSRKL